MKQQLHRSVTFWSGLLVIAFICWAWHDSYYYSSFYTTRYWTWANSRGGAMATDLGSSGPEWSGARARDETLQLRQDSFQRPYFLRGQGQKRGRDYRFDYHSSSSYEQTRYHYPYNPLDRWILYVPYWLIVFTFAALWLALLFWRARRRNRVVTP